MSGMDLSHWEAQVDLSSPRRAGPAARTGVPTLAQPKSLIIARMLLSFSQSLSPATGRVIFRVRRTDHLIDPPAYD
jgi:hypothetical protein